MGKSSDQVVGYKYYCGLMVAIGNTIEQLVNINPDNQVIVICSAEEIKARKLFDLPNL